MGALLEVDTPENLAELEAIFQNDVLKGKFLEGVTHISVVASAYKKNYINDLETKNFKIFKSAENVNREHQERSPGSYAPYQDGSQVTERVLTENTRYIRFYLEGSNSQPVARWLVSPSEVEGLTPSEIRSLLGTQLEPTNVIDVTLPKGTKVQEGLAGAVLEWNANGGGFQTYIIATNEEMDQLEISGAFDFDSLRSIGDAYYDQ